VLHLLVAQSSIESGRTVTARHVAVRVHVALRCTAEMQNAFNLLFQVRHVRARARCAVVGRAIRRLTVVTALAVLAMFAFGVVFAELQIGQVTESKRMTDTYETTTERIAATRRVVVALARRAHRNRLTVVGCATSRVTGEAWLAALALVAFGVVLTVHTVAVFQVALGRVTVAFATLAQAEVKAAATSRVAWCAVLNADWHSTLNQALTVIQSNPDNCTKCVSIV
jgi:hypothetical protein